MSYPANEHANSFNKPVNENSSPDELDTMSPSELANTLEQSLDSMTEETYDASLIDACLDALDRKSPISEMPDVEDAYARFQQQLCSLSSEGTVQPAASSTQKRPASFRRSWRVALVAAAVVVLLLGSMVVAQAAGVDVFGAMARWTDNVFSFGSVQSGGTQEMPSDGTADGPVGPEQSNAAPLGSEYSSLQDALDAYGVTEVTAPTWIPEGYVFDLVDDLFDEDDSEFFMLHVNYKNGSDVINMDIANYTDEPQMQVEKNDMAPETFQVNGITFYLIENANNYTVAWFTEHYECYIGGSLSQKENLLEMAYSMVH